MSNERKSASAATDSFYDEFSLAKTVAEKMSHSRQLIVAGFLVAITGIGLYCYVSLSAIDNNEAFIGATLALVGAGFLMWLLGAIRYFNLAIDSGDSDTVF